MKTYRATAHREEKWWVVEVEGVGATQGRSTAEAQRMAADLVEMMEELAPDEFTISVEFDIPGPLGEDIRRAREATREADLAQRKAAERTREVVHRLLNSGLSKQDIAKVLHVSPQRVSQLVKP
ncbi:hypothetical protein [Amycolatopsis sp. 195334CR]|uniref:hypothetical protein n=1 Tax=Amycolatopsis sp. 195334CR TaxID=2814588 RepID=UPI001A8F22D8|nr:hypothetical protein [Amycolatopsis sp. 195334CR]MBN6035963.1 hypothetical protein [Amycolatopsis sp. 195334CR]